MELKNGSKGAEVKQLQTLLGVKVDGDFGTITETAVKKWQAENGLTANGIVDALTLAKMQPTSTDATERFYTTKEGLLIEKRFLPKGEYFVGPTKKEFLFLHHTAGWDNPYDTISGWGSDNRGKIATEFVMGGQSIKGNSDEYDGRVVQAFPNGAYAWHLGKNGSQYMHEHSVGIEVCNFGELTEGGYFVKDENKRKVWVDKTLGKFYTWAGREVADSQVVKLAERFREHQYFHRYSDEQIKNLRQFILFIAERDSIDVRTGLIQEVKKYGAKGFEFNDDAYHGKRKGMWTHTNTRKDKSDMFPQQELLDMLVAL